MRLALPLVLASQLTGSLVGRILPPTDGRAAAEAVWIGDVSTPVNSGGWFRATGVPGGPTHLFVETSEGLYDVASPVTVTPGKATSVQLSLSGPEDTSAAAAPEKEKTKKRKGFWANPVSATLIIIGSAVVVGIAADWLVMSDDDEASPFAPPLPARQ